MRLARGAVDQARAAVESFSLPRVSGADVNLWQHQQQQQQ